MFKKRSSIVSKSNGHARQSSGRNKTSQRKSNSRTEQKRRDGSSRGKRRSSQRKKQERETETTPDGLLTDEAMRNLGEGHLRNYLAKNKKRNLTSLFDSIEADDDFLNSSSEFTLPVPAEDDDSDGVSEEQEEDLAWYRRSDQKGSRRNQGILSTSMQELDTSELLRPPMQHSRRTILLRQQAHDKSRFLREVDISTLQNGESTPGKIKVDDSPSEKLL